MAQVAMAYAEYIRQLMKGIQRPEVRAATGWLVQALDAAAEHKPKRAPRRAAVDRPDSAVAQVTRHSLSCGGYAEFSRELLEFQQPVRPGLWWP